MFGLQIPEDFLKGLKGIAKEKTIDDITLGTIWRDGSDETLWRVTHTDDKIHVMSVNDSEVLIYGVNMFFATFSLVEFGAICVSCKKKYEYTEKQIGFRCWGCKNGA